MISASHGIRVITLHYERLRWEMIMVWMTLTDTKQYNTKAEPSLGIGTGIGRFLAKPEKPENPVFCCRFFKLPVFPLKIFFDRLCD